MKSYTVDLYTFDELSEEAQWLAIRDEQDEFKLIQGERCAFEIAESNLHSYKNCRYTSNGSIVAVLLFTEITETREEIIAETREQVAKEIEATCHDSCSDYYCDLHTAVQIVTCGRGCSHDWDAKIARGGK